ncbi:hypothetical protein EGM88_01500 [Aureibaculum marinum]|uniref:Uncharacterized protein n=1 Tax=Aureibaculum marinum TaxID=2487930 RepID=A0A3N4NUX4_9FLAO|nr:hypothetical protein [Aureibaculum marinum]RPD99964.1 hypothetical protein EGM88_01500 [Aureibaculum marinum]
MKDQENTDSSKYNKVVADTTSIYSTFINRDDTIIWILVPEKQVIPNLKAKVTSLNKIWVLNILYYDSSDVKSLEIELNR